MNSGKATQLKLFYFSNLLYFLEEHFPSKRQILEEHSVWNPEISVYLGNNVLNQLIF